VERETLVTFLKGLGGVAIGLWAGLNPLVQLLLLSMLLDIATGLLAGYVSRTLSSDVSFRGMARKTLCLLLVWGAWMVGVQLGQPVGEAVAGFYCLNEWISILENAVDAKLPVPQFLRDALAKLSSETPQEPATRLQQ
jgi:toxin secretion/phage lysis holin